MNSAAGPFTDGNGVCVFIKSSTSNRRVGRGRCDWGSGSARALACCRWRLANDFPWLRKRSISARRRNGHARARALPGKEERHPATDV